MLNRISLPMIPRLFPCAMAIVSLASLAPLARAGDINPALVQAIQMEIDGEAQGIARSYFIEMGEKSPPSDIGFRSEAFLKDGPGGAQEIERILMTAYVPDSYPDGMILHFRKNFRKHFEEQGYTIVFGPEPANHPVVAQADVGQTMKTAPIFDFRIRRIPPPWLNQKGADLAPLTVAAKQPRALIEFFGGRVDASGIDELTKPLRARITSTFSGLGTTELSVVAGAGAAMAFVLLLMLALAPLRILRRRQAAQMRYRQYPAAVRARASLPPAGEPPVFKSGYREVEAPGVDPQVERIRATMAQMGIKEVLEILRNLEPRYRDQILQGLNVHKSIKSRIEKALASID